MSKFVLGNWKMNKNSIEAKEFISQLLKLLKKTGDVEIAIAAPFTLLPLLKKEFLHTKIKVAAQNLFYEDVGAYTGEISAGMLRDYAEYVIIGHSERRKYFNESDEIINRKIKAAQKAGLKAVLCIGETLAQKKTGKTNAALEKQLNIGLFGIDKLEKITIAYEPVWAISGGNTSHKPATSVDAQKAHLFIRKLLSKLCGNKAAKSIKIIYGGSSNPDNAKSLLSMPDIDGCLPGVASLDPVKFAKLIEIAKAL